MSSSCWIWVCICTVSFETACARTGAKHKISATAEVAKRLLRNKRPVSILHLYAKKTLQPPNRTVTDLFHKVADTLLARRACSISRTYCDPANRACVQAAPH